MDRNRTSLREKTATAIRRFFAPSATGRPSATLTTWGIVIAAMCGVLLGIGSFTFHYGEGLSYFSTDPAACTNCHIMQPQFDSWQKSSHHTAATCVDCHLPHDFIPKWLAKAENGYLHSKKFTFQDFHEPIFIRERNKQILHENCLACHSGLVHDMAPAAATDLDAANCVHCHHSVGHGEAVGLGRADDTYMNNK